MILFHAKRDGTVTTTPDLVPQGSSMQDLVVVSEFDYAYCAIKLLPASGEYIEDTPCDMILKKGGTIIWTASLPPQATVVAGSVDYQLVFTAADGATQTTLVGSFTVPRGVPVSTPPTVGGLSVKTINDLYTILSNISALLSGHDGDITQNKTDIAQNKTDIAALKKTISSAGYVTIPATEWTDNLPTVATVPISGVDMGSIILMLPANETTRLTANNAKLSAYPGAFTPVGGESRVSIFRAEAEKAPDADMTFAYVVIKTEYDSRIPLAAIIGVDAYGEGGGTASGVDETAVKKIINSLLGNVDNVRQYSADNPPPYPVTSVNGQTGAVNLPIPSEAADVKADPIGTAETKTAALRDEVNGKLEDYEKSTAVNNKISSHNTSTESHADLRLELQRLADRLNAALNSDDTSLDDLKEIVAYIKSNKTLIDGITSSKVNVTDIVNNLTTKTANVPLSAAQGVALKLLIDSLEEIVEGKVTAEQVAAQISEALSDYPTTSDMGKAISKATENLAPMSAIPTVPQTLPNPYALNLLGKTYNGASAVSLTVEEIMEAIKTASGGVIAWIGADNNIYLAGNLSDGTYKAYFEVDGKYIEIGDLTLAEEETPEPEPEPDEPDTTTYSIDTTYLVACSSDNKAATVEGGSKYTTTIIADEGYNLSAIRVKMGGVDITSDAVEGSTVTIENVTGDIAISCIGYKSRIRIYHGDGTEQTAAACEGTGFIPVKTGDVVYIKNVSVDTTGNSGLAYYNSDKTYISGYYLGSNSVLGGAVNGEAAGFNVTAANAAYIRFSAYVIDSTSIITVNEQLT